MCSDFGPYMIMCAGCRIAVCSGGATSELGCLEWKPHIESPDFIYYCPFCVIGRNLKTEVCGSFSLCSYSSVTFL